jgi:phytoene dehydrogenase-like protein
MNDEADAIVVGSGINGMVSAAELARAGWSVILVERNAEIGGFIATEERTLPGYLHDTFSSWHPLFVSGPAYAVLGEPLHRHGLEYRNTDGWVTASVDDDGRATFAHRDPQRSGGVRPRRGPVRLSHHAATTGEPRGKYLNITVQGN